MMEIGSLTLPVKTLISYPSLSTSWEDYKSIRSKYGTIHLFTIRVGARWTQLSRFGIPNKNPSTGLEMTIKAFVWPWLGIKITKLSRKVSGGTIWLP